MIRLKCSYGADHEFPDDWVFGGANGKDPRADSRWKPTTYSYYDEKFILVHVTQVPMCDDQAIDLFSTIWETTKLLRPVYIAARRPGDYEEQMLPVKYEPGAHRAFPIGD